MRNFENIEGQNISFSSCLECASRCCDGLRGFVIAQIILNEFEYVSKNFPIVFILDQEDFLYPVILLTNGKDFCRYFKDFECQIYEQRPSVCKIYPLSPTLENEIFVDMECPAVKTEDELSTNCQSMVKEGKVEEVFYNGVFEDFRGEFLKTYFHFKQLNKTENLEFLTQIHGKKFYKFKNDMNDEYIKTHLDSLSFFDCYYK